MKNTVTNTAYFNDQYTQEWEEQLTPKLEKQLSCYNIGSKILGYSAFFGTAFYLCYHVLAFFL